MEQLHLFFFLEINQHFSSDYLYNSQPYFKGLMLVHNIEDTKKSMLMLSLQNT